MHAVAAAHADGVQRGGLSYRTNAPASFAFFLNCRASIEVGLVSSCTLDRLAKSLGDDKIMADHGGAIKIDRSTISRLTTTSIRASGRIVPADEQLPIGSLSIAKCLMPTEAEQPNGHHQNKVVKELITFALQNKHLVTLLNRDDKAALQMDNVYLGKGFLQRRQESVGVWDEGEALMTDCSCLAGKAGWSTPSPSAAAQFSLCTCRRAGAADHG